MKYITVVLAFISLTNLNAGWLDMAENLIKEEVSPQETNSLDAMQNDALKAALQQGVEYAVTSLGKKDGYFNDKKAKIHLPDNIQNMESLIRKSGGDKMVDDLVLSMNNAATEAAPKTTKIFFSAIKKMTISDAQTILKSDENALTQYFKKHTNSDLEREIEPIIKAMMDKNKVSYYYKHVRDYYDENSEAIPYKDSLYSLGKSYGLDSYIPPKDLNAYVTKKAIMGLFIKIEQEEKKIRDNPLVQKSKLIRDVFGSI
ncbi:DUF4197 domain-containing protein [Campylobacterota bacterium]